MGRGGPSALLAFSALLLAGCGLPDPFYLSPPSVKATGSLDNVFQLQFTDHSTEPDFRGYELYYKIYANASAVDADTNLGGSTGSVDGLLQKGFLAVCRGPSIQPASGGLSQDTSIGTRVAPLIPIAVADRGSTFPIEILFNPGQGSDSDTSFSYSSPSTGAVQQEIDRHVNGISRCKPFTFITMNYMPGDDDIRTIWPVAAGPIYIAMYVVSYGLQNLSTPIYSYPVYMGYLQLAPFVP